MTVSPVVLAVLALAAIGVAGAAGYFAAIYRARHWREQLAVAETRVQGLNERLRDAHANTERRIELDREEQRVLQQLMPLRDSLGKLERTVVGIEQQRAVQHGELAEQLRQAARAE